jgi:hypothetical protein
MFSDTASDGYLWISADAGGNFQCDNYAKDLEGSILFDRPLDLQITGWPFEYSLTVRCIW